MFIKKSFWMKKISIMQSSKVLKFIKSIIYVLASRYELLAQNFGIYDSIFYSNLLSALSAPLRYMYIKFVFKLHFVIYVFINEVLIFLRSIRHKKMLILYIVLKASRLIFHNRFLRDRDKLSNISCLKKIVLSHSQW